MTGVIAKGMLHIIACGTVNRDVGRLMGAGLISSDIRKDYHRRTTDMTLWGHQHISGASTVVRKVPSV